MKPLTKAQRITLNENRIKQAEGLLRSGIYSEDEALRAINLFKENIAKLLNK